MVTCSNATCSHQRKKNEGSPGQESKSDNDSKDKKKGKKDKKQEKKDKEQEKLDKKAKKNTDKNSKVTKGTEKVDPRVILPNPLHFFCFWFWGCEACVGCSLVGVVVVYH